MSKLYIVRGVPGSGKSTYVKEHLSEIWHLETDKFFYKNGKYEFDISKIKEAHHFTQRLAEQIMETGADLVVSNTFTQLWEMQPYLDMASKYGYSVSVIRLENRFKNLHNVPSEVISSMENRFEDFPGEEIVQS